MRSLFGLLYTVLFFSYIVAGLFILFHFASYSLKRDAKIFSITIFLVVFSVLIFTNALLFFSLPIDDLFRQSL